MNLEIIDPTKYPNWDEMLLRATDASFFHSSAWARVLSESYGYTPLYFTMMKGDSFRVLVPVMEIKSFLTGKRGVSLPFTDYCEPIIEEGIEFQDILNPIINHGKKSGWKYIELRVGKSQFPVPSSGLPVASSQFSVHGSKDGSNLDPGPSTGNKPLVADSLTRTLNLEPRNISTTGNEFFITYLGHTLDLTKGEKGISSGLRDSTRRNINKAEKKKVEVRIEGTAGAIDEFCRLNCLTRREHGLPPQPRHFFTKVHREVISRGNGFVALAYHQRKAIAGNVYFHFGRQAVYKYGASDKRYQSLRANNLVMWEAIKWFVGKGFKSLCFGRTEPENEGLRRFKRGWGTQEYQIPYFKYDLQEGAFASGKKQGRSIYAGLLRATPAPVLNIIGSLLYRHMG